MENQSNVSKQAYMRKQMEKQVQQALTFLRKTSIKKNTINIREFVNKYGILFKQINFDNIDLTTQSQINNASKELLANIDPYIPITLVNDDGDTVVTFPPIFYPVNELNESASNVVDKLRLLVNQYLSPTQIDDIYSNLLGSMIQSQLTPEEYEALKNNTLTFQDIFDSKTEQLQQLFNNATNSIKKAKQQMEPDIEKNQSDIESTFELLEETDDISNDERANNTFSLLVDSE